MSYKNLKLKVWTRGDETRIYVNAAYVDFRDSISHADGGYLYAKDDGSIGWRHGFRTGPNTVTKAERVAFGMETAILPLFDGCTFKEALDRISSCLTKSGNFSMTQFDKRYHSPDLDRDR